MSDTNAVDFKLNDIVIVRSTGERGKIVGSTNNNTFYYVSTDPSGPLPLSFCRSSELDPLPPLEALARACE